MLTTMRASFMPIACKCPGALDVGTEALAIREDTGDVTAGGNAVHEVCQVIVRTGDRPEDLGPWIEKYACDADRLGVTSWQALKFWRQHGGRYSYPQTERPVSAPFGPFKLTGHLDLLSIDSGDFAEILDWKGGYRTEVDVEPQMRSYAYCVAHELDLERIGATVVWLGDQPEPTYQRWEWSMLDLAQWVTQTVDNINKRENRYTVGDHCRYCPRFFTCPAQCALVQGTLRDLGGMVTAAEDDQIEPERVAAIYPAVQNVDRLCKAYHDLIRRIVALNGPVPVDDRMALALIPGVKHSIDARKGWPTMLQALEGDQEEIAKCLTVKKADFLAAVSDLAPRGLKGKRKKEVLEDLEEAGAVTTKTITSLRMVRRKDDPQKGNQHGEGTENANGNGAGPASSE